jgi:hypothetical protein
MPVLGLHASHEQVDRGARLPDTDAAAHAEPGFDKIFLHHVGQEQDARSAPRSVPS